jgi:hypothetical protein
MEYKGGNISITLLLKFTKCISVYEGKVIQQQSVMAGQIVTKRNASLLFCGESDKNHCDSPLLVEEGRFGISDEIRSL